MASKRKKTEKIERHERLGLRGAIGLLPKGQPTAAPPGREVKDGEPEFHYSLCCEDCAIELGAVVSFSKERPELDPADSGLLCGRCAGERALEEIEHAADAKAKAEAKAAAKVAADAKAFADAVAAAVAKALGK